DGSTLGCTTPFGAKLEIPTSELSALTVHEGKATYLSDLKPREFEFTPFLGDRGLPWPFVNDGSVAGRELRMGGNTYDKGLGLESKSRISYELAGRYRRFEALVGLDEQTGQGGSVHISMLVDGKPQEFGNPELTSANNPLEIRVDVTGAQVLTLVVDFG